VAIYEVVMWLADMDECEHGGMCPNGVCINVDGSYNCRCNPGFRQSPNQQICIGLDACSTVRPHEMMMQTIATDVPVA